MKIKELQVTIYPAPAPQAGKLLYEADFIEEISYTCEQLYSEFWPLEEYAPEKIAEHFDSLSRVISVLQHIEIVVLSDELNWEGLITELADLLPQFAWISCSSEIRKGGKKAYYFDFVPIAYRLEGFPFDLNLQDSIKQQLYYEAEDVIDFLAKRIWELILEKELVISREKKSVPFSEKLSDLKKNLLRYEEENKRHEYAKERMRIANEKLEILVEKLEVGLMYSGLEYLKHSEEHEEKNWSKQMKISLREYSYLIQKAKCLEQMWNTNGNLSQKMKELVDNEKQLFNKAEQVNEIKKTISAADIYMVLDECKVIETRVVIKPRPLFRKPYVKLLKMDYDSLASKSAYFDILQGENYLIEKFLRDQYEL